MLPLVVHATRRTLGSIPSSCHRTDFKLKTNGLHAVFAVMLPSTIPKVLTNIVLTVKHIMNRATTLLCASNAITTIPGDLVNSKHALTLRVCILSDRKLRMGRTSTATMIVLTFMLIVGKLSNLMTEGVTGKW